VLGECPDGSLRTYLDSTRENQEQSRPEKGHGCSVNFHGEHQIGHLCRPRRPRVGDDESLGSPGVGMHF